MRKMNRSRSKSKGHDSSNYNNASSSLDHSTLTGNMTTIKGGYNTSNTSGHGGAPGATLQRYDGSEESAVPSWYKALKKNIK